MNTLSVTLKTVTPLFLGGADPKEQVELRIPPIKSAIRYWYRAWLGRYLDLAQMRKQEAQDLGLTDGQSSVLIRFDGDYGVHSVRQRLPFVGRRIERQSIKEGEAFTLRFISRSSLDWFGLPLALWLHCGGLGGRARRGAGVLNDDEMSFPDLQTADQNWKTQLGVGSRSITPPSDWSILSRATASILELKTSAVSDALGALGAAEKVYKTYRAKHPPSDQKYLGSENPRVASPIHFRPFKRDDAWWVRITVFKSRWAEKHYDEAKQFEVLDGLLNAFTSQGAEEVTLP